MSAPKTRHQAATRLVEFVGPGKDLNAGEVPTVHAALQLLSKRTHWLGNWRMFGTRQNTFQSKQTGLKWRLCLTNCLR
jgi:hypothetical protein